MEEVEAVGGCARWPARRGGRHEWDQLRHLEDGAPSFRRFAEARDWLLAALGGASDPDAPPPDATGPRDDRAARGAGRRGEVIQLAGRRAGPRRR